VASARPGESVLPCPPAMLWGWASCVDASGSKEETDYKVINEIDEGPFAPVVLRRAAVVLKGDVQRRLERW
jgi:hypothetical protein